ncbi:MAG: sugar-binding protein [Propionibacteriaceae bacterium]|jgi:putative multiple sugar transport system substrate-binding protein|nr:sugar-binding protein [Propionibacteriaceae bacterium]
MAHRKTIALLAGFAVALSAFAGCSGGGETAAPADSSAAPTEAVTSEAPAPVEAGGLVGITMPTVSLERWNNDGAGLKSQLEEMGYTVDLQYGDNKNELQIQQLENQINQGAKVLVIASIDGKVLGPTLAKAKEAGAQVLAYDRLIMETTDVDYYATFDNEKVGNLQGQYIIDTAGLEGSSDKFNFEPFAGSPDDNNAGLFFGGAWDLLSPYVDSGTLVINSETGKKAAGNWQDIGILEWKSATAQSEMENRLNSYYTDKKVQIVLSPNDSLAVGIAQALDTAGYKVGEDWPILTGQDGDIAAVKNIVAGKQSMTVWKDTRLLAAQSAKMVDQMIKGETVDQNNDTYDNGVKVVPTFLLDPEVVTADLVQDKLVGSGFLKAEDLQ